MMDLPSDAPADPLADDFPETLAEIGGELGSSDRVAGQAEEQSGRKRLRFARELNIVARRWRNDMDSHLKSIGHSQARWRTLFWIALSRERFGRAPTQKELAERLGVEGPTLVRSLDQLEKKGLIERHVSAADRRAREIALTAAATPQMEAIEAMMLARRTEILQDVTDEEIDICLAVFARISNGLQRL